MQYGPFYPSAIAQSGDGAAWQNPGNALGAPNGQSSTVTVPFEGASKFLEATGYNANVPTGKTVAEVRFGIPSMQQGGKLFNNSDQFIVGPLGEQQAYVALPVLRVESDSTPGLTPAVVNNSGFGLKFAIGNDGEQGVFSVESLPMYVIVED